MKKHEAPEFQVIRQNEANAKFFVASFQSVQGGTTSGTPSVTTYSAGSTVGWF